MRNKDDTIDRLLTAVHSRTSGDTSPDCLDGETLAAWMEDQLGGPALARAEAHAAGCARCQSMLAALARTADAGAGGHASAAAAPRSKFGRMLPWAAPLTAAATAAALYLAVRPATIQPVSIDRVQAPAAARSEQSAAALKEVEPLPAPTPGTGMTAVGGSGEKAEADSRARADEPSERAETRTARALVPAPANEQKKLRAQAAKDVSEQANAQFGDAVVPAPLPRVDDMQPSTVPPAPAPVIPPLQPASAESAAAPLPSTAARKAPQRQAGRGAIPVAALQESELAAPAPIDIPTPDPAIRWRIARGAIVQFSDDQGKTWTTQATGSTLGLTAGAAPSSTTCWIAGLAGTVHRTTDGRTWQRVGFPEPADLVSIVAVSAEVATVTTADGRTFATSDGGKTWRSVVRSP